LRGNVFKVVIVVIVSHQLSVPEKYGIDGGLSDGVGYFLKGCAYIGFDVAEDRWCGCRRCRTGFVGQKILRRFGIGLPLQYLLNSGQRLAISFQQWKS